MHPLIPATLLVISVVPLIALRARGKPYGIYSFITLLLSLPTACFVALRVRSLLPPDVRWVVDLLYAWGLIAAATHMVMLTRPKLRSRAFRSTITIPGMVFMAAGALSLPWLLALFPLRLVLFLVGAETTLHWLGWLDVIPALVALASVQTSRGVRWETVRFALGGEGPDEISRAECKRLPHPSREERRKGVLRIVQITDPHLGPWQPVTRLRERISQLVDLDPDIIAITGDLLTMEGAACPGALAEALAPLHRMPGRCFAVFGNHDHEWPDEVRSGLAAVGVRLLDDEEALVDTPVGRVQIVGADWRGRGRAKHVPALLDRLPRVEGVTRLLLLHDPSSFLHVPHDDVDLVLSGHTHGGQIGLVSMGLDWTVLSPTRWPDHGLFARGRSRLYVHRGTGFYGFPLRVGVPGEASRLDVTVRDSASS